MAQWPEPDVPQSQKGVNVTPRLILGTKHGDLTQLGPLCLTCLHRARPIANLIANSQGRASCI